MIAGLLFNSHDIADPKILDLEHSQKEALRDVKREELQRKEEEIALLKTEVIAICCNAVLFKRNVFAVKI